MPVVFTAPMDVTTASVFPVSFPVLAGQGSASLDLDRLVRVGRSAVLGQLVLPVQYSHLLPRVIVALSLVNRLQREEPELIPAGRGSGFRPGRRLVCGGRERLEAW